MGGGPPTWLCALGGSVGPCIGRSEKIPIRVPRVRDRARHQELPLVTYERLQAPRGLDAGLLHKLLSRLSAREDAGCAGAVPKAFDLSAWTVSRRFKRATARKLRELSEPRLEGYDLVVIILDGKTFAEDEMVVAVGVPVTRDENTLPLHRLGASLKTTNGPEPIHARLESPMAKVDHRRSSDQKQRWLATALLDLEPRPKPIKRYRSLPLARQALRARRQESRKSASGNQRGSSPNFNQQWH